MGRKQTLAANVKNGWKADNKANIFASRIIKDAGCGFSFSRKLQKPLSTKVPGKHRRVAPIRIGAEDNAI
jgi:hypothetical protein